MKLDLRLVMADPAGNRTAIVRTPVPAALRAQAAAAILQREELGAEQAGFETAPVQGGAGRLEMMGGEFCGNAARSYGYYLWMRKQRAKGENGGGEVSSGRVRIEISGSARPLEVECDLRTGNSFAEMPMPLRLEYSPEGYPLVISEGITHLILRDTAPSEALAGALIERYGKSADAFGIQFLEGDRLTPFVYVAGADSRVWESSCGSGSLAAAWYLERTGADSGLRPAVDAAPGLCKGSGPDIPSEAFPAAGTGTLAPAAGTDTVAPAAGTGVVQPAAGTDTVQPDGSRVSFFRFREPGGELLVEIRRTARGTVTGRMGGRVMLEEERRIELEI